MEYVIAYEVCALLFLIVFAYRFFRVRHFPNILNRFFGALMIFSMVDLVLDIVGSITIDHAAQVPAFVNYAINTVFYSMQVALPGLFMAYVLCMIGNYSNNRKKFIWLSIPAAIFILLLLANLFTGWVFFVGEVDGVRTYQRGVLFHTLYLSSAFYLLGTIWLTIWYRKVLDRKQLITIHIFLWLNIVAMIVQYFFPHMLLTGVGIALAIAMMFFTLENPENMTDLITGTFNYNGLITYVQPLIQERRRMFLVAIDVSGIRAVNNRLGVAGGNVILQQVGDFLKQCKATKGWVFRKMGTRFVMILENRSDCIDAVMQIKRRFEQPWETKGSQFTLSATIRYFNEPIRLESAEELINFIDLAFTYDEYSGHGNTKRIGKDLLENVRRATKVEQAVLHALETGKGFYLCYQPIYSTKAQCFTGLEVLLRLETPTLGNISPNEFITIAERRGIIHHIDQFVVASVCEFLIRHPELRELGITNLEINISAVEFLNDIYSVIDGMVQKNNCDPTMLSFEVTETMASTHQQLLLGTMNDMIKKGYRFVLDDFGTGYANLVQVTKLPFSLVKMDRSLLIAETAIQQRMFRDLLSMFLHMGMDTVIEGVETDEQAKLVTDLGGTFIQGYYYARPLKENDFIDFIKKNNQ